MPARAVRCAGGGMRGRDLWTHRVNRRVGGPGEGFCSVSVFEAPTVVTGFDDVAVMGDTVQHSGRHLGIAEHRGPFPEGEVGGDDHRGFLIKLADQMEQQLATGQSEGEVAELVEDDEIEPGKLAGQRSGLADPGFFFELVDQIDCVEEAPPSSGAHDRCSDGERQMGLAGACAAYRDDIAPGWQE